jgi:hypothetical protein
MRQVSGIVRPKGWGQTLQRVPLFVMISTSLKTRAEIREGSLLAPPRAIEA